MLNKINPTETKSWNSLAEHFNDIYAPSFLRSARECGYDALRHIKVKAIE